MGVENFRVNRRLLPIKTHYFFFYGAMGGVMPFIQVVAKGIGINATAVGLIFTIVPFCVFFSKPFFGYVTDYFQNIKFIVSLLACLTAAGYLSTTFIPAIDKTNWIHIKHTSCDRGSISLTPNSHNTSCLDNQQEYLCDLRYRLCDSEDLVTLHGNLSIYIAGNIHSKWTFLPNSEYKCSCISENSTFLSCNNRVINTCFPSEDKLFYQTYQFWVFTLLAIVAGSGAATVMCLSDAACYEVLGDQPEKYGRQRLWGTLSWGSVTLLAGFLNDLATGNSSAENFSPGFYVMVGLVALDLLLLFKIKMTKTNLSLNICQDLGKIFSSCETVAFATAVYIIGGLTGLLWSYQFWYLQDLGASQTLLGMTVAVQCIVAEIPFFYFAGWFIKKFGYFYCVSASFAAFALRLWLYHILVDPWMVLPIEVLHGLTFAVFYASMTGYASNNAPPGTEATMIGIMGGLFEGLGVATGSLLGGVGFDKLGGSNTFFAAAMVSLVCTPAFTLVHVILKKLSSSRRV